MVSSSLEQQDQRKPWSPVSADFLVTRMMLYLINTVGLLSVPGCSNG
uniref:Uncharacterized protein n=1 Tax=Anguilla anguilla TaxID=7936 RepID=A0A0E9SX95_ANGAN